MTTINDLPSEILLVVFENVQQTDLVECHKVCRLWYHSARTMILQNVTLKGTQAIEQFVDIFNDGTKAPYADAVKAMSVSIPYSETDHCSIDKDKIQKLFSFSNLTKITIKSDYHFFANFNDGICENILKNCPKLKQFNTNSFHFTDMYEFKHLYNIRFLISCLEWEYILLAQRTGTSAEQFLTMFPRVRTITSDISKPSFKKFLPIAQHISRVQRIELHLAKDKGNFAENYMAQQTAAV